MIISRVLRMPWKRLPLTPYKLKKNIVIMKTKWILIILKSLIQIVLDSMKEMESSGDVDADGVPLSIEYDKQGFILASLHDIVNAIYEDENEDKMV